MVYLNKNNNESEQLSQVHHHHHVFIAPSGAWGPSTQVQSCPNFFSNFETSRKHAFDSFQNTNHV